MSGTYPGWRPVTPPAGADAKLWSEASEFAHRGRVYLEDRELRRARECFERALELFKRLGDEREATVCIGGLADVTFFEGDIVRAGDLYEEACQQARMRGDTYVEALSLAKAGGVWALLGDREIQRAYWRRAASLSPEFAELIGPGEPVDACRVIGSLRNERHSEPMAAGDQEDLATRPAAVPEPADSPEQPSAGVTSAGLTQTDLSSLLQEMSQSLDDAGRRTADPSLNLLASLVKGEDYRTRQQWAAARDEYAKALEHAARVGEREDGGVDSQLALGARLGLAEVLLAMGEPSQARAEVDLCLPERSLMPQPNRTLSERVASWEYEVLLARIYEIAGRVDLELGRIEDAEAGLRMAVDICRSWQGLPMPKGVMQQSASAAGICSHSLATLYQDTGRPELALDQLKLALSAFEAARDVGGQGAVHLDFANALADTLLTASPGQRSDRASSATAVDDIWRHFETARDLYERVGRPGGAAQVAGRAGLFSLDAGLAGQAQAWLEEARRLHAAEGNRRGMAMDRLYEGEAYSLLGLAGREEEALSDALRLAHELELPELEWKAHAGLGALGERQGELENARAHFEAAADVIESLRTLLTSEKRKVLFFGGKEAVYEHLIRICLTLRRDKQAFLAVERSRSRALLDLLRDTKLELGRDLDPAWAEREAELVRSSRTATRSLDAMADAPGGRQLDLLVQAREARQSLESLLNDLAEVAPEHVALRRGQPASFEDVQQVVASSDRRVILVEYFTMQDVVVVFGVASGAETPQVVELPLDQQELRRFVRANLGAHDRVRELIADGLEELWHGYDYLIEPVATWANPDDLVYLIPHGILHYLPLHALAVRGSYLIERNPVIYAPSASMLKFCRAKRKQGDGGVRLTAAVFGDSRGDLPYARTEAEEVGRLLGASPFLGDAVSRSAVEGILPGTGIVHFAVHGYFSEVDPLRSGLRLNGGHVLTAQDVFGLPGLDADLVTLSGCETGINESHSGDELIGLTRAFLYAGTSSVLVSLWRVADDSTAFFMQRFYNHLRENRDVTKVDALRQAMLETKAEERWASFDHWAPFVLVGDWR